MKICFLLLLLLPLAYPVPAADIAPEIAPVAAKFKADFEAAEAEQAAAVARSARSYSAALDAAEKTATGAGDIKSLTAITAEKNALKNSSLKPAAHADLPKSLLAPRKAHLTAVTKAEADTQPRKQRAIADCVRALSTLESRAAGNANLIAQIGAEKERVLRASPMNLSKLSKRIGGTRWKSSGNSNLFINEDGTANTKLGLTGTWKAVAEDRIEIQWAGKRGAEEWTTDDDLKTLTNPKDGGVYKRQN
jgi:hypothetical protein